MEKEILNKELKKVRYLLDVAHLPGVQQLKEHVAENVIASMEALARHHGSKTDAEVRALCATLAANLNLYQLITGAKKKKEAIEEALREHYNDIGEEDPPEGFS